MRSARRALAGNLADTSTSAVLLEDAAKEDALIDVGGLEPDLGNVCARGGSGWLLEDATVVLSLAAVVVGDDSGDALERSVAFGVEYLEGAMYIVSAL